MDTMTPQNNSQNTKSNWLNIVIAVTIAIVALLGSFIAKAQSEASSAAAQASNKEQEKYYQAIGKQISGEADVNNAFGTEYQLWYRYDVQLAAANQRHDEAATRIFTNLRDTVERTSTSRIFDPAYFNKENAKLDLALYKADIYIRDLYQLEEEQQAASEISAAWEDKASTYGLQLTLLVVAGFLLGLALMTNAKIPIAVFTSSGIFLVVAISIWSYGLSLIPIAARPTSAIQAYAQGASLSDQGRWDEALIQFNAAIKAAQAAGVEYPHAYLRRAQVYIALQDFEKAIEDYQVAKAHGLDDDPTLNTSLVSAYFQTGDFKTAIAIGTQALSNSPDDLLLHQQVALALLASGDLQKAAQENNELILDAAKQAEVLEHLGDSAAEVWWLIDSAAHQYDLLIEALQTDNAISANVQDKDAVRKGAEGFAAKLRAHVVTLKYGLTETSAVVSDSARISDPKFILSSTPDGKYTYKVGLKFQYKGLVAGQLLSIVVYRNNIEDPSWGYSQPWAGQQAEGAFNLTLNPSFDSFYIVPSGSYNVDIYINNKLLSQGEFTVGDPGTFEDGTLSTGVPCDSLNTDTVACAETEALSFTDWPEPDWPELTPEEILYYECLFDPSGPYCDLLQDSDGDTVPDFDDACPYDYGDWYNYGCPASAVGDIDGDGIANFDDYCPFDFGFAENYGCPIPTKDDWDGDAVLDVDDSCPYQAGPFDNGGCPVTAPDTDGDFIPDNLDYCPTEYGAGADGCPAPTADDTDGDGVLDADDLCLDQPGPINNSGCPITVADTDGDTIPDDFDLCPKEYGTDADGCPVPTADDGDGDGVLDVDDICPDKPGPSDNSGCPITVVDTDGDAIPDDFDLCPTEYGTDADGCPVPTADDTDGDGVLDVDDLCPDKPGPSDNSGCPIVVVDTDGDTVPDDFDLCPTEYGTDADGCPVPTADDTDGDGVLDVDDLCPDKPGPLENGGCPATTETDTDGDGTPDSSDDCPDLAGPADNFGCPYTTGPDTDGDGVSDADDVCPTEYGPASNYGCPITDSDGDGVDDSIDYCPYDVGLPENDGCPDSDGDGLHDGIDYCPYEVGPPENNGCPTGLSWLPSRPAIPVSLYARLTVVVYPRPEVAPIPRL